MKTKTMFFYNLRDKLVALGVFYLVMSLVFVLMTFLNTRLNGGSSSGVEMSSIIFMFVIGLCSFREPFFFAQANGVSRKSFFLSSILAVLPLALLMPALDLLFNRLYNLFVPCATFFDMIFGQFSFSSEAYNDLGVRVWFPNNEISHLFANYLWTFCSFLLFFALGLFITLVYYRCGKLMKWVVSAVPVLLLMALGNFYYMLPRSLLDGVARFFTAVFFTNSYMACLGIFGCALLFSLFVFLLCRKAPIKG